MNSGLLISVLSTAIALSGCGSTPAYRSYRESSPPTYPPIQPVSPPARVEARPAASRTVSDGDPLVRARQLVEDALEGDHGARRLDLLRQAAELAPEADIPHYWLGVELLEAGELEESEGELRTSLSIHEEAFEAHLRLGQVLILRGDWKGACASLERASQLAQQCGATPEAIELIERRQALARAMIDYEPPPLSASELADLRRSIRPQDERDAGDGGPPAGSSPAPNEAEAGRLASEIRASLVGIVAALRPVTREQLEVKAALSILGLLDSADGASDDPGGGRLLRLALDFLFYSYRDDPETWSALTAAFGGWTTGLPPEAMHELAGEVTTGAGEELGEEAVSPSGGNWVLVPREHPANGVWLSLGGETVIRENGFRNQNGPLGPTNRIEIEGETIRMTNIQSGTPAFGNVFSGTLAGHTATLHSTYTLTSQRHVCTIRLQFSSDWSSLSSSSEDAVTTTVEGRSITMHVDSTGRMSKQ